MKKIAMFMLCYFSALFGDTNNPINQNLAHIKMADSDIYVISLQESAIKKEILLPQNEIERQIVQNAQNLAPNKQNIILVKNPNFIALVDCGFPHTQANLKTTLKSLGVKFDDVTHLIITHAHGDHIGGILNENGDNNFPNATLLIDKNEFDYWQKEDNKHTKDSLNSFKNIKFFSYDSSLLEGELGIYAIKAYGHTPGHNLISFQASDDKLVFIADLLHIYALQSKYPQIPVTYDIDKVEAARIRDKFLKEFRDVKTKIIGAHMPFTAPIILDK